MDEEAAAFFAILLTNPYDVRRQLPQLVSGESINLHLRDRANFSKLDW